MKTGIQTTYVLVLLFANGLHADTLVLKNGQTVAGKSFVRQGDALVVSAGPNGEPVTAAPGIPLAAIASLKQADGQMDWPAVLALLQRRQQQVAIERERLAQVHARLQQLDQELRHWLQDGGQCGAGGDPCS